ncbi:CaiB/BaiF CoA transferase family protein [Labrys okinawensis]|uniref:CaiB/BaiF CoA transferase family protein n=1 Tax=Labrys okinawensis TaxID=346911 RepID=UPI0039BCA455
MQLGDLGADIAKVEEPGQGDESRRYGPPFVAGESAYYMSVNRNKRSIAIDLKSPEGKKLALDLAAKADVVIENFRPGAMERLGLGYEDLRKVNPRLIYCGISGFGRSGPEAGRPGYDLILQGEGGLMSITGEAGGPPLKLGTSIADLVTGLYATQAVLAGLAQRERTGTGGRVDVSMLDCMASLLTFNAGMYFASGKSPARRGNAHPTISPYEAFEAKDGWFNLGVANDKFWSIFCRTVGREELLSEPDFASAPKRVENRPRLRDLLAPMFLTESREHWLRLLTEAAVPCGAIRSVGEVCEAENLKSRGVSRVMRHPKAGDLRYIASAVRFDDLPPPDPTPPPLLGQHGEELLADWLSHGREDIEGLAERRAFYRPV